MQYQIQALIHVYLTCPNHSIFTFRLDKLDGIRARGNKRKIHGESPLVEDDDDEDDPYDEREEDMRLGKKRVS